MTNISNILITGGAGFVGSHAAAFFDDRGAQVTVLDNLSRVSSLEAADETRDTAGYNWEYLRMHHPDIKRIEGDIRDRELVFDAVEGQDAVVHTAGQVAVTSSLNDPHHDFEVNAGGTFNIVDAASTAESDPSVAFASTNKVYGKNVNTISVRECETRYRYDDSDYRDGIPESLSIDDTQHTPYGVSKLAGDLYIQDYAKRNEVSAATFRMSCIYGTRQFGNEDQGWVAHFILSAIRGEPITIFGDGKQVRDVLYVDDLIRAYDAFLSDPGGKPAVYNIGGGSMNTTSLIELLNYLDSEYNYSTTVRHGDWREGDQRVYISDVSRAREQLNWQPQVDFETGIGRFIDWAEKIER